MIASAEHERILTWWEADSYCKSLNIDGFTDWRLPNNLEMLAIRANFVHNMHTMNLALTSDEPDSKSAFESTNYWCGGAPRARHAGSGWDVGNVGLDIAVARCIVTNYQRVFEISRKLKVKPVRTVLE